ncbi:MAG: phosphotransferase, partial [Pseudomonadota bacterium]
MSCDLENAINALAPALLTGGNRVSNLKRLSGGASQETWRFTVETADGDVADRILRRAPNGQADARSEAAISLSGEAELIKAVGRAGVPVPPVRHICSEADDLGSAFIMDFVPGETLARRILRDDKYTTARGHLARDCGQSLAAVHATDL